MSLTDDMTPDEIEAVVEAAMPRATTAPEPKAPAEPDDYNMAPYAKAFAIWAHGDQKYGDQPYEVHLAEVVSILDEHGYDVHFHAIAVITAWLHDVIEDTFVTFAMIAYRFGDLVAKAVFACTGEGSTRKEKQAAIHAKLLECEDAQPAKAANMRASLREKKRGLVKMYSDEFDTFITGVSSVKPSLLKALHEVQAQSLEFLSQ